MTSMAVPARRGSCGSVGRKAAGFPEFSAGGGRASADGTRGGAMPTALCKASRACGPRFCMCCRGAYIETPPPLPQPNRPGRASPLPITPPPNHPPTVGAKSPTGGASSPNPFLCPSNSHQKYRPLTPPSPIPLPTPRHRHPTPTPKPCSGARVHSTVAFGSGHSPEHLTIREMVTKGPCTAVCPALEIGNGPPWAAQAMQSSLSNNEILL